MRDVRNHGCEVRTRNYFQPFDQRPFDGVCRRDEESLESMAAKPTCRNKNSVHMAHRAVKSQLSQEGGARGCWSAHHGQRNGYGHWQVEAAAFLAELGRCQVDCEALPRKLEPTVADCRTDALARFLHRCGSEANDAEGDLASGSVRLHLNTSRFEADENAGVDRGEHRTDTRWEGAAATAQVVKNARINELGQTQGGAGAAHSGAG